MEPLLNRLRNCACFLQDLPLFRSLFCYYFTINPIATTNYIGAYRKMWINKDPGKLAQSTKKGNGEMTLATLVEKFALCADTLDAVAKMRERVQ